MTSNIVGIFVMFLRISKSKVLSWIARFYISFFRGVPLLVVLFLTYFGINMDAMPAAIVSFTLVPSAFLAEYYRSALKGVGKSQYEAVEALGLPYHIIMMDIILPQAFRIVLPSLGNVMLDMFKGPPQKRFGSRNMVSMACSLPLRLGRPIWRSTTLLFHQTGLSHTGCQRQSSTHSTQ